jgi:hypothetical protein
MSDVGILMNNRNLSCVVMPFTIVGVVDAFSRIVMFLTFESIFESIFKSIYVLQSIHNKINTHT